MCCFRLFASFTSRSVKRRTSALIWLLAPRWGGRHIIEGVDAARRVRERLGVGIEPRGDVGHGPVAVLSALHSNSQGSRLQRRSPAGGRDLGLAPPTFGW